MPDANKVGREADATKSIPRPRGSRFLRHLIVTAVLIGVAVRVSGLGESLFYWPTPGPVSTPRVYEDVEIVTSDGVTLHAWFMPAKGVAPGERAPAILHAHGNAGSVESHESFSAFLTEAGFHVLLFDYRGYGQSERGKRPNRDRLTIDTRAALDVLIARSDVDPDRVGALGVSLGGAFALRVTAEDDRVRSVATMSAFSSFWRAANDAAPGFGWLLVPRGVEPEESAALLGDRQYLIMHGLGDSIVRADHAERLERAAADTGVPVERYEHPSAGHNDLVQSYSEPRTVLIEFFRRTLKPSD